MKAITLFFPERQPNTALGANARRTGKIWSQKQATDTERQIALTDLRREFANKYPRGAPFTPWILLWTAHYKGLKAPDVDSLASMLKAWQDVLAEECGFSDGPRNIPEATYRVELNSPLAPCMTLKIRHDTTLKGER